MKSKYLLLVLVIIAVILCCEKDEISREEIIGNWLFEKEEIDSINDNSRLVIDTTIIHGNQRYIINASDTLNITDLAGNSSIKFWMEFQPPETIVIYNCPIDFYCITNIPMRYRIVKITNDKMIWRRDLKYLNQEKVIYTLYFIK